MAIAFGASAKGKTDSTTNSLTYTGPTVTGSNTVGVVHVLSNSASGDIVTGVTWGGTSMTRINVKNSGNQYIYAYYITNPSSAASIVISLSANSSGIYSHALYYTGASQTGIPDSQSTGTATGNLTLSTTVVVSGSWVVSCARNASNGVPTASTGVTARETDAAYALGSGDSNGMIPLGSSSQTWNSASGTTWGVIYSLAPVSTIAYGGSVNTTWNSGQATVSQTGPTITGSNTLGVVVLNWQSNESATGFTVTWGGSNMTFVGEYAQESNTRRGALYYIYNPSSAATVSATRTNANAAFGIESFYYTGVKQSGQPDSSATPNDTSKTTFTESTTVVASDCWLIGTARNTYGATTASTGTKSRGDFSSVMGPGYGDSNGIVGTSTQSLTWTAATNTTWNGVVFSIAPYVAPSTNIKNVDGVAQASIKSVNGVAIASIKSINGIT